MMDRYYWCCPDCGQVFMRTKTASTGSQHMCPRNPGVLTTVSDPRMNRIVIKVEGGIVQSVDAIKKVDVMVVDIDEGCHDPEDVTRINFFESNENPNWVKTKFSERNYCPKCHQNWAVHNDDGSCVKD